MNEPSIANQAPATMPGPAGDVDPGPSEQADGAGRPAAVERLEAVQTSGEDRADERRNDRRPERQRAR